MNAATEPSRRSLAERLGRVQVGVRSDLEISRHVFRGRSQYVIQDPITFQSHVLPADDYQVFVSIDAHLSLAKIFEALVDDGVLTADGEEGFYQFILQLHQLGFLSLPVANDRSIYTRMKRKRALRHRRWLTGCLFIRVPLINPDALLERTVRFARPVFTRPFFLLWCALMVVSVFVAIGQWHAIVADAAEMFAPRNLILMWVALIGLKVVHEFGHGYAC